MTATDKFEALMIEAALHQEGTEGYIAEKLGKLALIRERVDAIHKQISELNRELGDLQNLAWGYQCDIDRVKNMV